MGFPLSITVFGTIIASVTMMTMLLIRRRQQRRSRSAQDRWESHVFPHGPLVELVPDRMWQVTGSLKHQSLPRNMVIFRMDETAGGGRPELWVHSVIALDPDTMRQVEELGTPAVLVVPNRMHRSDCAVWRQRFPQIRVICPQAARDAVEQVVHVDATCEEDVDKLRTRGILFHQPEGVRAGELVFQLSLGENGGSALVFTDLFFNMPHGSGFFGWLFRMLGSTGFFGMTGFGRLLMLQHKTIFRDWVSQRLATIPDIRVISVAHGKEITHDCNARLCDAAARLH